MQSVWAEKSSKINFWLSIVHENSNLGIKIWSIWVIEFRSSQFEWGSSSFSFYLYISLPSLTLSFFFLSPSLSFLYLNFPLKNSNVYQRSLNPTTIEHLRINYHATLHPKKVTSNKENLSVVGIFMTDDIKKTSVSGISIHNLRTQFESKEIFLLLLHSTIRWIILWIHLSF